ncbi:hypothetical protein V6N13_096278 [Hibiscus sabdariffa]
MPMPQPRDALPDDGCVGTDTHFVDGMHHASSGVDYRSPSSSPIMQTTRLTDGSGTTETRVPSHVIDEGSVLLPPDMPSQVSSELLGINEGQPSGGQPSLEDTEPDDVLMNVNEHPMITRSKAGSS